MKKSPVGYTGDFKCSCVYVISFVYLFLVESGGLVYVRNRYNTESVFVLEHPDTLKHAVITTCHTTAYQDCSHTTNPTPEHRDIYIVFVDLQYLIPWKSTTINQLLINTV